MRVGIDIRAVQFSGALRGTGRYILNLLNGLSAVDTETEYYLLHYRARPLPPEVVALGARFTLVGIDGQTTLEEWYPWYQATPLLRRMRVLPTLHWHSYLRRSAEAFNRAIRLHALDLVHFPTPFDLNLPPVPEPPCKTVYTFHDGIPLVFKDQFYESWPLPTQKLYDWHKSAIQAANRVIAISESSKNDAVKIYNVDPSKLVRIYNGITAAPSLQTSESFRTDVNRKFQISKPYFLFCSVIDWHKGFDALLTAFASYRSSSQPKAQLVIVGVQQPAFVDALWKQARDLELNNADLCLTGFVRDDELQALYEGSIALITPSRYEGFGLPAAEAMALGVPVIAANRSSLPEVVGEAGLLIDPDQPDTIVEAMKHLATSEELRQECVNRGLEQVKKFALFERAKDVAETYRQMVRAE